MSRAPQTRAEFALDSTGLRLGNSAAMKLPDPQLLITIFVTVVAFSQDARAVNPPPDGGYPNGNTAEGQKALLNLTSGGYNTAVGFIALASNMVGGFNTGIGAGALLANTSENNTATGAAALLSNTTGTNNTATGAFALFSNVSGTENTAVGTQALTAHTGSRNTAVGALALLDHQTGDFNNAFGALALRRDTNGIGNNAIGDSALENLTNGSNNVAIGDSAGQSLASGSGNVYIGGNSQGANNESNHTYIRNINGTTVSGGGTDTVTVNLATGLLGHLSSSRRYKENIKPINTASEALYRLNPVSYRYKKDIDSTQACSFGLIAEEVAAVNPDLVARNSEGQPESVHYEMVNAMLLNEFLKEHRTVLELKEQIAVLTATVKEQAAQIEKVSAEVRGDRSASQIVFNRP